MSATDISPEWADAPRTSDAPDDLGRQPFIDSVVKRIERSRASDPSTVFGVVGSWGAGKSSVVAKVRDGLSGDWTVSEFTPWSSADSASMSLEFVNTLADLLGDKADGDTRRKLAGYAGFISPMLQAIPYAGDAAKGVADKVLESISRQPPWHKQFEDLSKRIQALGQRVLIIVDDVDRLDANELLALLRIVRLLGRFEGVHYLIAYDQATIEDLLASTGSVGRSSSFMEKIVQFPFEVPPISRAAAIRLVNEAIEQTLAATGVEFSETDLERALELVGILAPQIDTPRTLARFREQLMSFADHVENAELDLLDFVAVTWLRLSAHGAWESLERWHQELTSGKASTSLLDSHTLSTDDWESRVESVDRSALPADVVRVLSFLFPGVSVRGMSYHMAHPRALSDQTYFGRYLVLALPEDDVSDELIRSALDSLATGIKASRVEELAAVLDGEDHDLANLAIARASKSRLNATATSTDLLEFLAARLTARKADAPTVGAPQNAVRAWIVRELGMGLRDELISAHDAIGLFGEGESFALVLRMSRANEFRAIAKTLATGFAAYWEKQLSSRLDELLKEDGELGMITDLIIFARGKDRAQGLLDFAISDFASYARVAQSFVQFERWVGSSVHYSMAFRRSQFIAAVSRDIRVQYAPEVEARRIPRDYEVEDLAEPIRDPAVLRAFTLDALASLSEVE